LRETWVGKRVARGDAKFREAAKEIWRDLNHRRSRLRATSANDLHL